MFKPEGVYVAMLTPFDEDGTIMRENCGELLIFRSKAA